MMTLFVSGVMILPPGTVDCINIVIRYEGSDAAEQESGFLNQELAKGINALLLILTGSLLITLTAVFLIGDGDERSLIVELIIVMALHALGYFFTRDEGHFKLKGLAGKGLPDTNVLTYDISEAGMFALREGTAKKIDWHEIMKVTETEQYFSVLTPKKPYVLPKACFHYFRDILLLREILRRKVAFNKLSLFELKVNENLESEKQQIVKGLSR